VSRNPVAASAPRISKKWKCHLWLASDAANDRESGKNGKCAAILTVFRENPDIV
jgi:hypothetical protein